MEIWSRFEPEVTPKFSFGWLHPKVLISGRPELGIAPSIAFKSMGATSGGREVAYDGKNERPFFHAWPFACDCARLGHHGIWLGIHSRQFGPARLLVWKTLIASVVINFAGRSPGPLDLNFLRQGDRHSRCDTIKTIPACFNCFHRLWAKLYFMPDLSHVTAGDWAIMAFGWAFIVGSLALLAYFFERHPSRRALIKGDFVIKRAVHVSLSVFRFRLVLPDWLSDRL
jgi:hypothetical protein